MEPQPPQRSSLIEIFAFFLRLGAIGFGGPTAHIALMETECVGRLKWLDREHFLEGLAVCQALPGPASTQLAIGMGWVRGGFPGALAAGVGFILPAFALLLGLAYAYFRYGTMPAVRALFWGFGPAVLAIILSTSWRLGKSALTDPFLMALAVLSLGAVLFRWETALVLLGAGAAYLFVKPGGGAEKHPALLLASNPALPSLGVSLPLLAGLSLYFLKAGAFIYGGGLVLIPLIERDVVDRFGWLTRQEFLDGVALGQMTPGPVVITATFVGYRVAGWAGAVAATVAIFLPSFVFILAAAPVLGRIRNSPNVKRFLKGANAAVVGALVASVAHLAPSALPDGWALALGIACLALLMKWKWDVLKVFGLAAGAGVFRAWISSTG